MDKLMVLEVGGGQRVVSWTATSKQMGLARGI